MALGLGKRGTGVKPMSPNADAALTAAAAPINLKDAASWQMFRLNDKRWQTESWRHYDICGEMRFVANWLGQAISRCVLYAAEIDENGEPGSETSDKDVVELIKPIFGGPAGRAEAFRITGINQTVAGEIYFVQEGGATKNDPDKWYVVSSSELRRAGDEIIVTRSMTHGGKRYTLDPDKDALTRCWTPHPRIYDAADSSVRAVLPVLREIEQSTKRVFAEIDSRLAGAGLLPVPQSLEFPHEPGQTAAAGFSEALQQTAALSLQQRDSAAAVVPIVVTVPDDVLGKINPVYFNSQISEKIMDLRIGAVERLAASLDVPPEVLKGMGKSSHWNAWQVEESTIKIHVEPLLIRIVEALNVGYFKPALKAIGKDPDKFTLWFDVSPLAVRPNRSDQALQAGDKGLLSDEAQRKYADFTEDDAPTQDEKNEKWLRQLVLAAPALIGDPEVQKILGLPNIQMPAPPAPPVDPNQAAIDQGLPNYDADGNIIPPDGTEPADAGTKALPSTKTSTQAIQGALFFAADAAVRRALELAGGRLVPGRERLGAYAGVARHNLHTRVWVDPAKAASLLAGGFDFFAEQAPMLGVEPESMTRLLDAYCRELMASRQPHSVALLKDVLDRALVSA